MAVDQESSTELLQHIPEAKPLVMSSQVEEAFLSSLRDFQPELCGWCSRNSGDSSIYGAKLDAGGSDFASKGFQVDDRIKAPELLPLLFSERQILTLLSIWCFVYSVT
ncbi:hypothetical protein F2Q69_00032043 [Brassica cretica]|uniref:Uncharacterized protein n=1 Tax=Brassica cretica TaxID=69181 RepID=A0A8S9S377_BRACR|nr:hypothetical protein F2Q69_00032043 [Brassica cretica]